MERREDGIVEEIKEAGRGSTQSEMLEGMEEGNGTAGGVARRKVDDEEYWKENRTEYSETENWMESGKEMRGS